MTIDTRGLSAAERDAVVRGVYDPEVSQLLFALDYKEQVATPREFFTSPYFIGPRCWDGTTGLYPIWLEELCYVLDPKNQIYEWVLGGSLGAGKTLVALLALQYHLYKLWCLRKPHDYLGLAPDEQIEFFFFNTNLDLVEDNALGRFDKYLNSSPYFRRVFPENRRKKGEVKIAEGGRVEKRYQLEYPPYFAAVGGSTTQHQIGRNIICGMMDETNFIRGRHKDQYVYGEANAAYKMYTSLRNRIESRFLNLGQIPGLLILISSARSKYDFLEQHKETLKGNPHARISEFSRWEVSPWKYSTRTFRVFVGGTRSNSKVLEDDEVVPDGGFVINVPLDFKSSFERDLNLAIQDVAGIPSDLASPLIPIKEQIYKNVDHSRKHPFSQEVLCLSHLDPSVDISTYFDTAEVCKWSGPRLVPKHYPDKLRHIHVDLGLTNDSASISMGAVAGLKPTVFEDKGGRMTVGNAPIIWLDFSLRIDPPQAPAQIPISAIRSFIMFLRNKCGFAIGSVSFDGFASEESVQILQNELDVVRVGGGREIRPGTKHKYPICKVLSVDRTGEPYKAVRAATIEERILRYPYVPYETEIATVQMEMATGKVDHLPNTTKDVADSVAGVVWHCVEQVNLIGDIPYTEAMDIPESSMTTQRNNPDRAGVTGNYKVW